jgi:hypothetical protein
MTSCVSNLLPAPRVIEFNGTKWKDLGLSNLTYSPSGGTVSTASVITQYGAITLGNYNPLISSTPNGDTCFSAIILPSAATSTLSVSQTKQQKWFTFTPTTPEIKITLTNTSMGSSRIEDLIMMEGACMLYRLVAIDSSYRDTSLTIILHEAVVGVPYFITTVKCSTCEKRLGQATSKVLGKTPKELINDRTLLEAKRLLVHGNQSIKEIGFYLGFEEPTNFIKYFRKHTDKTPVEFRESYLSI